MVRRDHLGITQVVNYKLPVGSIVEMHFLFLDHYTRGIKTLQLLCMIYENYRPGQLKGQIIVKMEQLSNLKLSFAIKIQDIHNKWDAILA